eukprot:674965_1
MKLETQHLPSNENDDIVTISDFLALERFVACVQNIANFDEAELWSISNSVVKALGNGAWTAFNQRTLFLKTLHTLHLHLSQRDTIPVQWVGVFRIVKLKKKLFISREERLLLDDILCGKNTDLLSKISRSSYRLSKADTKLLLDVLKAPEYFRSREAVRSKDYKILLRNFEECLPLCDVNSSQRIETPVRSTKCQ